MLKKKAEQDPAMDEIRMERAEERIPSVLSLTDTRDAAGCHQGSQELRGAISLGHSDVPRLRQAGVDCVILSAFPHDRLQPIRGVRQALEYIDVFHELGSIPG